MKKGNSGNANTVLIVVVLVIIVALGVWWFTMRSAPVPVEDNYGIVNDSLPTPTTVQTTTTTTNTKEENPPPPPPPPPVRYVPEQ